VVTSTSILRGTSLLKTTAQYEQQTLKTRFAAVTERVETDCSFQLRNRRRAPCTRHTKTPHKGDYCRDRRVRFFFRSLAVRDSWPDQSQVESCYSHVGLVTTQPLSALKPKTSSELM